MFYNDLNMFYNDINMFYKESFISMNEQINSKKTIFSNSVYYFALFLNEHHTPMRHTRN